ncbi:Extracellular metalloproteinase [Colletotrichum fructicola]|uniref:Extracellular metalloproteinase n=1 Tax=Colletotrichum fructicola (strain Nara gc5) TaxID=1213859 RepID=L2FQ83_COLFN|nr:Extracellular metalloproteinase [Colletotrichum fructicola]KAE9579545.1 Extracellular metalloproteinase [Colletotrichum fructicola]KAF4429135.1 Extracellular metalloproteinase mep [Colletotrichum fructicola]KAF4487606.1 Extracellular metalloproteinase mep [Colletotrichum fructicola Nara gc5]KAF4896825.1 Extracellular metalloproteinase mep [Colletotrichum fructicola]
MYRSMKSLALLGLLAPAYAHPAHGHKSALARRGVDIEAFRLPQLGSYTNATLTESNPPIALLKRESYVDTATELVQKLAPNAEFRVVGDHYVGTNGIAHVNFKQTAHGLDIDNADFNVNIGKDGKVFSFGNNFFSGEIPEASPLNKRDFKDPVAALNGAKDVLQLPVESADASAEAKEGKEIYTIKGTSGAVSDPEAKLAYLVKGDGSLALTWRVETDITDNWLLTYVDAQSGGEVHGVVDYVSDLANYRVYPWGVNDPTEGDRVLVSDPWDIAASEFTWHSDGPGSNYTTTRGNNGIAQSNPSGGSTYLNNYRPTSSSLNFDYEYTTSMSTPSAYIDASITQLFYTANHYHDLLYELGFNEAAGNFEINNNGQGGAGNDFVILNAQDGSGTNNANFATPPDGSPGRMRMYLWTQSTPRRDCSFEAGVVIHEYTHGLSTRLTGGPANSNCLNAVESGGMGEGWGDFFATAIRLKPTDTRATDYPMGAWVYNNPAGIRTVLYSTSMTTTPNTYSTINGVTAVHRIGETWATILYEVLWNLIDKYGKNDGPRPEFNNGVPTDGKYLTLKLVMDGMALQPCSPNFIQARDAILDADTALTGGANQCELWTAFAKRGLGSNAVYSSSSRRDGFTIPSGVC